MSKRILPTIKSVAKALMREKERWRGGPILRKGFDVRLQVLPGGTWHLYTGDPSDDYDHRGFWGEGFINSRTNCRALASELISEVSGEIAQSGYTDDEEDNPKSKEIW